METFAIWAVSVTGLSIATCLLLQAWGDFKARQRARRRARG